MNLEIKENFTKIVNSARELTDFCFNEINISDDEKIKQTIFESNFFRLYISLDLLREELHVFWKRKGSHEIIPDPIYGICFFSKNTKEILHDLEDSLSENERFSVVMKIYKENYWVFSSYEWLENPDFIMAINNTDAWAFREFRALKPGEYEKVLCSYKKY